MAKTRKRVKTSASKTKPRSKKRAYHNPTVADWEAGLHRVVPVGEIPERYPITDHRRIFLDVDHLRAWDTGIFQYFPKPEKVQLTGLERGAPGRWDSRLTTIYGSVMIEDGLWRMWFCCMPEVVSYDEMADHFFTCYAESDDGIHWRKPDLGVTGRKRYPGNNLLPIPGAMMGVVKALPGSNYKYMAATTVVAPFEADVSDNQGYAFNGFGTYLWVSDDGLRWRQHTRVPLVAHGDVACLFADHETKRYLFYQKTGLNHGLSMRRSFLGMESADGKKWEGYEGMATWRECFKADDYDDLIAAQKGFHIADHYGLCMRRVGDLYVSAQTLFLMGNPLRMSFGQNPNGLCHMRLAYSHNGFNWHHPKGRPAWLELGRPGELDSGFVVSATEWVDHGDDMLLYVTGQHAQHGLGINPDFTLDKSIPLEDQNSMGHIMLARQKRDRFASLGAPYKGVFEVENSTCIERTSGRRHAHAGPRGGDALLVNAVTRNDGSIRVAILEFGKKDPLSGFSFDDCVPFTGDAVRGQVRFKTKSVGQIPRDMGLSVRFELRKAEIFGYEWGGT